ncbi:LuxR C-terminal-related transcriptional regulator [Nocardioides sp. B-3]|uniref:LuxR C-terminal-related transcriptional regulator n=1 Tax=Nocardioides sp. B-3 TaxID=2895565 RepID=UPI002152A1FC|nr:LuxR C-terminal-related transcriptional regulator [Nocardioides sp. B-3]UUZ59701.1 LuxR C-terminal-related transcriptional regulator [Nocardioides sp. B-3]
MTIHSDHPFATPDDAARRLRGRLGGRVSLWTAGAATDRAGLTVSSLLVATGDPSFVIGLLDPDSDLSDRLRVDDARCVVQLLSWGHHDLAEQFAGQMPAPGGLFAAADTWLETPFGPRLADVETGPTASSATSARWAGRSGSPPGSSRSCSVRMTRCSTDVAATPTRVQPWLTRRSGSWWSTTTPCGAMPSSATCRPRGSTWLRSLRTVTGRWPASPAARPQVVVLDLQIPGPNGVEVTAQVLQHDPSARVLILSASGEQNDVLEAVKAGATGYLVKSASRDELLDAVRRVAAGDTVFTPGLAGPVLGEFRRMADGPADDPRDELTDRETEILKMVAKGMSYKQIAERLVISHRTVQNHVQNTLRKLQMNNRVQLTRWAIEHGLDDED